MLVVHVSHMAGHSAAKMATAHTPTSLPQTSGSFMPLQRRTVEVAEVVDVLVDVEVTVVHVPQSAGHSALNITPVVPSQ